MADSNLQVPWTEDQWNRVKQVVRDEARGARVAGNILPLVGPLHADASYVTEEELILPYGGSGDDKVDGFTVDDTKTRRLSTVQVKVFLRNAQVADPELTSALTAFRRAANVLAHLEDEIVFNGQPSADQAPPSAVGLGDVRGGQRTEGLVTAANNTPVAGNNLGEALVAAISGAVGALEGRFHLGPFACVLGQESFKAVQTPNNSLALPQDRILPFLGGGPLARSSSLDKGLVIALGGAPIDLVMATDMTVEFLQTTQNAWFVFRVYEKMVLRIKQKDAVQVLSA